MIIDLNILKRLFKRFGVWPISKLGSQVKYLIQNPQHFVKASSEIHNLLINNGYEWDYYLNGYKFGENQKIYVIPNGVLIWVFKDILARFLDSNNIKKWISPNEEFSMGKANAFFKIYGKLTNQNLGQDEYAGENVDDTEKFINISDDSESKEFSKSDIQKMLSDDYPIFSNEKSYVNTLDTKYDKSGDEWKYKDEEDEENDKIDISNKSSKEKIIPNREKVGQSIKLNKFENIVSTILKLHGIDPKAKPNKQQPLRLTSDEIIDIWKRAKDELPSEEGEKLITWLKNGMSNGTIQLLNEEKIKNSILESIIKEIIKETIKEIKKLTKNKKIKLKDSKQFVLDMSKLCDEQTGTDAISPVTTPRAFKKQKTMEKKDINLDEMTTTSGGGDTSQGTPGYTVPNAWVGPRGKGGSKSGVKGSEKIGYTLTSIGKKDMERSGDILQNELLNKNNKSIICPKCENKIIIINEGKIGNLWWVHGRCSKCGKGYEIDNF